MKKKRNQPQSVIPRLALFWLLLAQMLVIGPHLVHIPQWIAGLWLLCAGWRIQVYRMRWRFPRPLLKIAMMLSAAAAVYWSRGSLIGLDAGVALLITAFTLKLVELQSRRDALVLVFLGFFAIVTGYLYDDSLLAALYSLLPLTTLLAAWAGLQEGGRQRRWSSLFRPALVLLAQAIPLALVLFLFFPRLDPLWSLPQPKEKGMTGLSGQMSPGDIAELSQSTALVFRATFSAAVPPRTELYWRALTLPFFDGRNWQQGRTGLEFSMPQWQPAGAALDYNVLMQPTGQPWLFSLATSVSEQSDIRMLGDLRLQRTMPVHRSYLYRATAWPDAVAEGELSLAKKRQHLQLPREGNPRARAWAAQLRRQHADDEVLVQALLLHFNQEPYHYTLKPPLLGEHSVDEFLFKTRSGFCEHYSSTTAFVLRAAGIPARVVLGYQGGEFNPEGNFVQVRQLDAHAWVEYWLPERGWQRVDPTFQVAPERVEQGLQDALGEEASLLGGGMFSAMNYRHLAWVNAFRISWDNLNHSWQTRVLGYQAERQRSWLRQWLGEVNWQHIGLAMVAVLTGLMLVLAVLLIKPWQQRPAGAGLLLQRLDRLLASRGMVRNGGEGLRDFARRCAPQLSTLQQAALDDFISEHEQQVYAEGGDDLQRLRQRLQHLRKALKQKQRV